MFGGTESRFDPQRQMEAIRNGDMRALARAITLVENRDRAAVPILRAAFPYTGRAKKVGITGPPGVGKSSLSGRLAREYCAKGFLVAVLAVDPSSPFTGGAMLGDRIRMQSHSGIYIRSMATRGHMGGLASATVEVIDLLDAAAFDRILVESVGAGQDEVEITFAVDALLLLMAPGLGDSVQLLKSGLNEAADIFVLNKCNDPAVENLERDVRAALESALQDGRWRIPVVLTNAITGDGSVSLLEMIEACLGFQEQTGNCRTRSIERWKMRLLHGIREAIERRMLADDLGARIAAYAKQVVDETANPYELVHALMAEIAASAKDYNVGARQ